MLYAGLFIAGFLTWCFSTLSGGGGAMTLVPILSFMMGAQAVAPVVTIAMTMGGFGRFVMFRKEVSWPIVKWALPCAITGAVIGGYFFSVLPADWLQLAIGLFLVSTMFQDRFARARTHFKAQSWMFGPVYFAVGGLSAVMGAIGPVMNVLFLNAGVSKERMVGTKTAIGLPMQCAKLVSYAAFGALAPEYLIAGGICGLGAVLSNALGRKILARMSHAEFRYVTLAFMVLAGCVMLWKQRGLIL